MSGYLDANGAELHVGDTVRTTGRCPKVGEIRQLYVTTEKNPRRRAFVFFDIAKTIGGALYPDYEQPWDIDRLEALPSDHETYQQEELAL